MAETLLISVLILVGFAIVLLMDAHGKSRAYERGVDPNAHRSPEAVTSVELPPPHFNEKDPDQRGSEAR
jgi:hypothetical protein